MIGIVTFHTALNYGAVLQAYGLQKFLNNNGYDNEIINYDCPQFKKDYAPIKLTVHIKRMIRSFKSRKITLELQAKYKEFVEKDLICSEKKYDKKSIQNADGQYDFYITGSDQVWDPYCAGFDATYFLDFVTDNYKKISYAASFDQMSIPEMMISEYKKRLSSFRAFSCREKQGADMISKIVETNVSVNVDPTFLIDSKEWSKIAVNMKSLGEYVFVYPVGHSEEMLEYAKKIARMYKLKVVYLVCQKPWKDKEVEFITGCGPKEFLGLIKDAQYVVTNAFHGTAFSLIFKKKFYVYCGQDGKGNARVQSVLKNVNLNDRIICENIKINENDINWSSYDKWVENERQRSLDYIINSIDKEEKRI